MGLAPFAHFGFVSTLCCVLSLAPEIVGKVKYFCPIFKVFWIIVRWHLISVSYPNPHHFYFCITYFGLYPIIHSYATDVQHHSTVGWNDVKSTLYKPLFHKLRSKWVSKRASEWANDQVDNEWPSFLCVDFIVLLPIVHRVYDFMSSRERPGKNQVGNQSNQMNLESRWLKINWLIDCQKSIQGRRWYKI